MSKEPCSKSTAYDGVWEDTLIFAVRDMQWREQVRAFSEGKRAAMPPALLKLDGNAESALGDAIASADGRFFLLEFKGHHSDLGTEHKKSLVAFMKKVASTVHAEAVDSKLVNAANRFIELSRLGHFFVFPLPKDADKSSPLIERKIEVLSSRYYDAAQGIDGQSHDLRHLDGKNNVLNVSIHALIYAGTFNGLDREEMSAYMHLLAEALTRLGGKDDVSMKAVLLSDDGFAWPIADVRCFALMSELLLRGERNAEHSISHETSKQLEGLKALFPAKADQKPKSG